MSVDQIYNARNVDDRLTTSGQPSDDQLRAAAAAGFDTVINLAPHDAENALPDEAGLVRELGMTYHHLPVVFANPTERDFAAFEQLMVELRPDSRTLLHCAANFRVSAFYGLYAIKHLGWSAEQAEAFRAPIWNDSDYPVWEAFISEMEQRIAGADAPDAVGRPAPGRQAEVEAAFQDVIGRWSALRPLAGIAGVEFEADARRTVEQALWVDGARSVLDIGGGYGLFPPLCAALGARAVDLDSFHAYSEGRREHEDEMWELMETLGVELVRHDALHGNLPFPDATFDAVTTFDAMEHFHRSPRHLFAEVVRVSRRGGVFVLGVPNAVNLRKRVAVPLGKTNWARFEDWYEPADFEGHVREPVVADLARIAEDMRLDDWQIVGRNWLGYRGSRARAAATRVADRVLRLRPALCANIYLIGRFPRRS